MKASSKTSKDGNNLLSTLRGHKTKWGSLVPVIVVIFVIILAALIYLLFSQVLHINIFGPRVPVDDVTGQKPVVIDTVADAEPVNPQDINGDTVTDTSTNPDTDKTTEAEADKVANKDTTNKDTSTDKKDEKPATDKTNSNNESIAKALITDLNEEVETKNGELKEMKAMLELLEEQNNDPERIALYKELIKKTKTEISETKDRIKRYKETLEE
jgi:hypothetical protein